ncbi:MAG: type II toxin-antitoxin system RelE/ParE family toxin [Candidatus Paceibacterota bacterium]
MAWSLVIAESAYDDLAACDDATRARILKKLTWFEKNFDNVTPVPLTGEFSDYFKLRVGKWRVFYTIQWKKRHITVHHVARRDEAYKKK